MTKDAAKQPADTRKTAATTKGAATPQADDDDVEGHSFIQRGGGKSRNSGVTGGKKG